MPLKKVCASLNEEEYKQFKDQARKLNITIYAMTKSLLKGFLDNAKASVIEHKEIDLKRKILSELKTDIKSRRIEFIPTNELGVILLFGKYHDYFGFKILDVRSQHSPDCIASKNNEQKRIEFEYKASNFITHNHNLNEIDLIVCWIKDRELPIEVLELSSQLAHFYPNTLHNSRLMQRRGRPPQYTR